MNTDDPIPDGFFDGDLMPVRETRKLTAELARTIERLTEAANHHRQLAERYKRERDEARAFIGRNVHCTCLPYAQPGDGTMCQRCEFLREVEQ